MSDSISDLETQLTKLRKARASGLRAVSHGDVRTEYKSDSEMAAAIADLERRIEGAGGRAARRRVRYLMQSGKGL